MSKNIIFSKFGWGLLIASSIILLVVCICIPDILAYTGLSMKETWPSTTKIIVQLTIGSWTATLVAHFGGVIIRMQAQLAIISSIEYEDLKSEMTEVQNIFLWILGLMTALSGYVTLWLSGG